MRQIFTLILFNLLHFISFGQFLNNKENLIIKKADSLFDAGDYNQSSMLYSFADSINPKKTSSLYCKNQLAECYLQQGLLNEAEKIANLVIRLSLIDNKDEKSNALLVIGQVYLSRGSAEDAKRYFLNAFDLLNTEKNSLTKSKVYDQLGIYHWLKGNQQKALELLTLSLDMRKELVGENNLYLANSYNNLGLIQSADNPDKALENYKKALFIYQSNYSFQHPKVGITLNNIAITQRQLGLIDESVSTFIKALELWKAVVGEKHSMIAFIYTNLGETYSYNKNYQTALTYLQHGLNLYKSIYGEKHPEVAATYNSIGNLYLLQSKYTIALLNFQSALCANSMNFESGDIYQNPSINNYYNPDLLLISLILKSKSMNLLHHEKTLKIKDLEHSLNILFSCDSLISKLRHSRTSMKDKIELGKQSAMVYDEAIQICLELSEITLRKKYYQELAFYFSEKNKGSVLQEAIADVEAKSFAGIPDSLLLKEKELKQSITFYEQQLSNDLNQEEEKLFRKKLFELSSQYDHHIQYLEINYPDYYNLKFNTLIAGVEQIQKSLKDEEVLISYFISEEKNRLILFSFSNKKYSILNKSLPENFIKEIKSFRNSIKIMANESYLKSAFHLYSILLPSIPANTKNLIIIPDGKLGSIPYEALLSSPTSNIKDFHNLPFLIKKYSISYNYSSQLFYNSRLNETNSKSMSNGILLCAPINFDSSSGLNSLPGTEKEVERIAELFHKNNITSNTLLNDNADESTIKKSCSRYEIIHLASHGVVNEAQPELSQLYLKPSTDQSEDGNLYSGEIYNLKINAELVVLSACQTGLGNYKKGEGIIGLTRAFLYSGADNLMVSLWTVSDESTCELMIQFYTSLLNQSNHQFTRALRDSKLNLISNNTFSHPYYWAPFILIGK